jgi:hypothetical protein
MKSQHDNYDHHLRDVLLDAIGLDNARCDLPLAALVQKVAAERKDLVGRSTVSWAFDSHESTRCLIIEEENGDVNVVNLGGDK